MDFDVLYKINQWARDAGIIRDKTYARVHDVICWRDELRLYAGIESGFKTVQHAIEYYLGCYKTATGRKMSHMQSIKLIQEIYRKESQHEFEYFCK